MVFLTPGHFNHYAEVMNVVAQKNCKHFCSKHLFKNTSATHAHNHRGGTDAACVSILLLLGPKLPEANVTNHTDLNHDSLRSKLQEDDNGRLFANYGGYTCTSAFQPIVSLTHARVVGHEGLLRAQNAAGRILPATTDAQPGDCK